MSVPEVGPDQLERELGQGAAVAVLDIRDPEEFARWRVDTCGVPILNVPLGDLDRAVGAIAAVGRRELRVICTRGKSSVAAVEELVRRGVPAASVRGGMIAWGRLLVADPVDIGTPTAVVQLRRQSRGCLSYVLARDGQALVVDPAPDVDAYVREAERLGARITGVLDTHVHADHLSGARALADRTGAALHLSRAALARGVRDAGRVDPVADGDLLPLGAAEVRVLALPGHTSDNTGLLVDGRALVLGDSLFADAVARPDLEAGDEGAPEAARVLYRTLRERVLTLPDDLVLLPCHYAGGRVPGAIAPTLGEVRRSQELLELDEDAFVERVLSEMPERPQNYRAIIAVNLGDSGLAEVDRLEVGANNCAAGPGTG